MDTYKINDLQVNAVLDREAMGMVDGGWGIPNFVKKYSKRAYNIFKKPKNRVIAWNCAKKGYGYAKKAVCWLF